MSTVTQTRAPKRRIEKIRNRLGFTITDSNASRVLHVAEDSKTLVRIIIDVYIQKIITTTADYHMVLQLAPGGTSVITPQIGQVLDEPAINLLLLEQSGAGFTLSAIDQAQRFHWQVDSKAMRKMKETDQIKLQTLSDVASAFTVTGHVTLFFKE